ncbi:armadillo-type protein [Mycena galopus ATCC 62051]|nr:armadillo-type protein [Mycena galopus ATCC 62051]
MTEDSDSSVRQTAHCTIIAGLKNSEPSIPPTPFPRFLSNSSEELHSKLQSVIVTRLTYALDHFDSHKHEHVLELFCAIMDDDALHTLIPIEERTRKMLLLVGSDSSSIRLLARRAVISCLRHEDIRAKMQDETLKTMVQLLDSKAMETRRSKIVALLGTEDSDDQQMAWRAMGVCLGDDTLLPRMQPEKIPVLVKAFGSGDWEKRQNALKLLNLCEKMVHLEEMPDVTPKMLSLLSDDDDDVREAARDTVLTCLKKGEYSARGFESAFSFCDHENADIGWLGNTRIQSEVVYRDRERWRVNAHKYTHFYSYAAKILFILCLVGDPDSDVRRRVLEATALCIKPGTLASASGTENTGSRKIVQERVVPIVVKSLGSSSDAERQSALQLLTLCVGSGDCSSLHNSGALMSFQDVVPPVIFKSIIQKMLSTMWDESMVVRQAGQNAISACLNNDTLSADLQPELAPALVKTIDSEMWAIRHLCGILSLTRYLVHCALNPKLMGKLCNTVGDEDPDVRRAAWHALGVSLGNGMSATSPSVISTYDGRRHGTHPRKALAGFKHDPCTSCWDGSSYQDTPGTFILSSAGPLESDLDTYDLPEIQSTCNRLERLLKPGILTHTYSVLETHSFGNPSTFVLAEDDANELAQLLDHPDLDIATSAYEVFIYFIENRSERIWVACGALLSREPQPQPQRALKLVLGFARDGQLHECCYSMANVAGFLEYVQTRIKEPKFGILSALLKMFRMRQGDFEQWQAGLKGLLALGLIHDTRTEEGGRQ